MPQFKIKDAERVVEQLVVDNFKKTVSFKHTSVVAHINSQRLQ